MSEEENNTNLITIFDAEENFERLRKSLDPNSIMAQTMQTISQFQNTINNMSSLNKVNSNITKDSTLEETNERLENIEKGFQSLQQIASENAKISNLLNASAAEFLVKFEKASMDNQKSARIAIILATLAVIATIISPFLPNIIEIFK